MADLTREVLRAALINAVRERDEARALLAAVIAGCDRIEADAEARVAETFGGPLWGTWARRKTAQHIRAIARGEDE